MFWQLPLLSGPLTSDTPESTCLFYHGSSRAWRARFWKTTNRCSAQENSFQDTVLVGMDRFSSRDRRSSTNSFACPRLISCVVGPTSRHYKWSTSQGVPFLFLTGCPVPAVCWLGSHQRGVQPQTGSNRLSVPWGSIFVGSPGKRGITRASSKQRSQRRGPAMKLICQRQDRDAPSLTPSICLSILCHFPLLVF